MKHIENQSKTIPILNHLLMSLISLLMILTMIIMMVVVVVEHVVVVSVHTTKSHRRRVPNKNGPNTFSRFAQFPSSLQIHVLQRSTVTRPCTNGNGQPRRLLLEKQFHLVDLFKIHLLKQQHSVPLENLLLRLSLLIFTLNKILSRKKSDIVRSNDESLTWWQQWVLSSIVPYNTSTVIMHYSLHLVLDLEKPPRFYLSYHVINILLREMHFSRLVNIWDVLCLKILLVLCALHQLICLVRHFGMDLIIPVFTLKITPLPVKWWLMHLKCLTKMYVSNLNMHFSIIM
mmetsp:Transcript_20634/g.30644  ORF Transcript_20634/g.30644 Transcript_20634/m.30644 type:complete len:287 (+) Transcript_20634:2674-3534(+)